MKSTATKGTGTISQSISQILHTLLTASIVTGIALELVNSLYGYVHPLVQQVNLLMYWSRAHVDYKKRAWKKKLEKYMHTKDRRAFNPIQIRKLYAIKYKRWFHK